MSTIEQNQRERGFELSLQFYKNDISFSDAVEQLTHTGLSRGSASDYVRYLTEYMDPNKTPTRTMSTATQTLFMKGVLEFLGKEALHQWATNDLKHFDYYEGVSGAKVVSRRKNLKKYIDNHATEEAIVYPDEINVSMNEFLVEGAMKSVTVNYYERSPEARQKCIDIYGYDCYICGFDFEKVYGEIGKSFIHVHHLTPLSEMKTEYKIKPESDLRPVCPNCHAMLHKKVPAYSINEIKKKILT